MTLTPWHVTESSAQPTVHALCKINKNPFKTHRIEGTIPELSKYIFDDFRVLLMRLKTRKPLACHGMFKAANLNPNLMAIPFYGYTDYRVDIAQRWLSDIFVQNTFLLTHSLDI